MHASPEDSDQSLTVQNSTTGNRHIVKSEIEDAFDHLYQVSMAANEDTQTVGVSNLAINRFSNGFFDQKQK